MQNHIIFLPVLAQILLTFLVFVALDRVKKRAARDGLVDEQRRALHADAWPDDVLKASNNIKNQFELPVLFYGLCFIVWATGFVNMATLLLAIVFVLTRYVHAFIHLGNNVVKQRSFVFRLGVFALIFLFVLTLWSVIKLSFY